MIAYSQMCGVTQRLPILALVTLTACAQETNHVDSAELTDFGTRYTAAWNSQNAASVAAFYAEEGSLTINDGEPSAGRAAITEAAQGFMTAFPDMVVTMDSLGTEGDRITYHWTLTGTNTGPGGTGNAVRISGYEAWLMSSDGLIADSQGHYDEAEYQRQLESGVTPTP